MKMLNELKKQSFHLGTLSFANNEKRVPAQSVIFNTWFSTLQLGNNFNLSKTIIKQYLSGWDTANINNAKTKLKCIA
jgi:hypothetical protein